MAYTKPQGKEEGNDYASHVDGDTEGPDATAANIYMLSHSAWWKDKETDVQSSLSCPKSHSWKAKELLQTQVCQE